MLCAAPIDVNVGKHNFTSFPLCSYPTSIISKAINDNLLLHRDIQETIFQYITEPDMHNTVLTAASISKPDLGGLFASQVPR